MSLVSAALFVVTLLVSIFLIKRVHHEYRVAGVPAGFYDTQGMQDGTALASCLDAAAVSTAPASSATATPAAVVVDVSPFHDGFFLTRLSFSSWLLWLRVLRVVLQRQRGTTRSRTNGRWLAGQGACAGCTVGQVGTRCRTGGSCVYVWCAGVCLFCGWRRVVVCVPSPTRVWLVRLNFQGTAFTFAHEWGAEGVCVQCFNRALVG